MRIVDAVRYRRRIVRKGKDFERRVRALHRGLDKLIGLPTHPCPQCGQPGPHFVPPSFGDGGFYTCDDVQRATAYVRAYGRGRVAFDLETAPQRWHTASFPPVQAP